MQRSTLDIWQSGRDFALGHVHEFANRDHGRQKLTRYMRGWFERPGVCRERGAKGDGALGHCPTWDLL